MIKRNKFIKEYTDYDELKTFCEQTWGDYIRGLDNSIINHLLCIQSHGLKKDTWFDNPIIDMYYEELPKFPPVPFDIIVFRGGDIQIPNRPFLSASFFRKTALKKFAHNEKTNFHKIIVRKGACIVPSLYMAMPASFTEQEVVLDVSKLHKKICYYEYY